MANNDLNNAPNTDQDINNTPMDQQTDYAAGTGGASNPDLDVGGNTEGPGPGGSGDRLGNLGGGTPGRAGQTTNMDAAGAIERADIKGQSRDEERTGNDDGGLSGSSGTIGATAYGTYNAPNDQTGASNTSTGGGFDDTATADAGTPVMQRGSDLASPDVMSGNPRTGADTDQVPQARTDATLNENYSTGPRRTDPEQELLNPGYDPRADRNTTGPNRADDRVPPGLPGLPDQRGTLDQTTYNNEGNNLGTNAGTGGGAGLP